MKDNYNDLKELFEDWKEAHKKDDHWLDTFPKCPCCGAMPPEDFKISFTYDGYLTDNKEIKLLFIGRESNVSADIKAFGKAKECFWMKDGKGKVRENYEKYLKEIAEALHVDYKNCAYMNINKRGGYGACSYDSLLNYVNVYRKFIKNEIEIS